MTFPAELVEVVMKPSWIAVLALACASLAASAAAFGVIPVPATVPEPDAYGLMLGGLGALTLLGRRRKAPAEPA
jgi:hypothetical protein